MTVFLFFPNGVCMCVCVKPGLIILTALEWTCINVSFCHSLKSVPAVSCLHNFLSCHSLYNHNLVLSILWEVANVGNVLMLLQLSRELWINILTFPNVKLCLSVHVLMYIQFFHSNSPFPLLRLYWWLGGQREREWHRVRLFFFYSPYPNSGDGGLSLAFTFTTQM